MGLRPFGPSDSRATGRSAQGSASRDRHRLDLPAERRSLRHGSSSASWSDNGSGLGCHRSRPLELDLNVRAQVEHHFEHLPLDESAHNPRAQGLQVVGSEQHTRHDDTGVDRRSSERCGSQRSRLGSSHAAPCGLQPTCYRSPSRLVQVRFRDADPRDSKALSRTLYLALRPATQSSAGLHVHRWQITRLPCAFAWIQGRGSAISFRTGLLLSSSATCRSVG